MLRKIVIAGLILSSSVYAQTPAHKKSAFAIRDPMYNSVKQSPAPDVKSGGAGWLYGPAELECRRLQLLREKTVEAQLKVGYPGTFHTPYNEASFRFKSENKIVADKIKFRAAGSGNVYLNGQLVFKFNSNDSIRTILIPKNKLISELRFDISTPAEPPALLIEKGAFSSENTNWEWMAGTENWKPAFHFAQTSSGTPPHRAESAEVTLKAEGKSGELYDFGRELFGYITIRNPAKPTISVGESTYEALDTGNAELEQSLEMVPAGKGVWKSRSPLAFRYLLSDVGNIDDIQCDAIFYPVQYRGAFACSDSLLTRIWMNSAYTLRLCMHDFLMDGVKRDRLPWAGDLAMSMMANAYSFGDAEIVRRSLTVLGRAGIEKTDINGIIDYSLWWIISQDHYQLYFGDRDHLKREWSRIKETFGHLISRCDASGFISPKNTWLFIDWVNQEKWTALQVLWWWAQQSGANLAERMGDTETAEYWREISEKLKGKLTETAWSQDRHLWLANPEFPEKITRHANFLAVISGLATKDQQKGIGNLLSDNDVSAVGTPYMAGFENMALARLGDIDYMLERTREYWGGMVQQGATTFWEGYDSNQQGKDQYSFYGRPYAKSLCHAWSAGPAAFLPAEILGLKPLEDGWKRFSVHPDAGSLNWVNATVPTPYGSIILNVEGASVILTIPAGTTAVWENEEFRGPLLLSKDLR